jgi:hypothetical protein
MSDNGKPNVAAAVPAATAASKTMLSANANLKAVIKEIVLLVQHDVPMDPDVAAALLRGLKGETDGVNPLVAEPVFMKF